MSQPISVQDNVANPTLTPNMRRRNLNTPSHNFVSPSRILFLPSRMGTLYCAYPYHKPLNIF